VLGLTLPELQTGNSANFILVDPSEEWMFDEKVNKSKSSNSPFLGQKLRGRVNLVCNNDRYIIN
jgi:dihydroorotase